MYHHSLQSAVNCMAEKLHARIGNEPGDAVICTILQILT